MSRVPTDAVSWGGVNNDRDYIITSFRPYQLPIVCSTWN